MKGREFSCPSGKVCWQTPVLDVLLIGSSLHRISNPRPGCQASENSLELDSNLKVQQVRNSTDILSTLSHFSMLCPQHFFTARKWSTWSSLDYNCHVHIAVSLNCECSCWLCGSLCWMQEYSVRLSLWSVSLPGRTPGTTSPWLRPSSSSWPTPPTTGCSSRSSSWCVVGWCGVCMWGGGVCGECGVCGMLTCGLCVCGVSVTIVGRTINYTAC